MVVIALPNIEGLTVQTQELFLLNCLPYVLSSKLPFWLSDEVNHSLIVCEKGNSNGKDYG